MENSNGDDPSEEDETPRASSPVSQCPICLEEIKDPSSTNACVHKFCFNCLKEWSKVKAECPLCKKPFTNIHHNMRSANDFDQESIVPPSNNNLRRPQLMPIPRSNHENEWRSWLRRELGVLLNGRPIDAIISEIMALIVVHPIMSMQMRNYMNPQLGFRTDHFLHQLYNQSVSSGATGPTFHYNPRDPFVRCPRFPVFRLSLWGALPEARYVLSDSSDEDSRTNHTQPQEEIIIIDDTDDEVVAAENNILSSLPNMEDPYDNPQPSTSFQPDAPFVISCTSSSSSSSISPSSPSPISPSSPSPISSPSPSSMSPVSTYYTSSPPSSSSSSSSDEGYIRKRSLRSYTSRKRKLKSQNRSPSPRPHRRSRRNAPTPHSSSGDENRSNFKRFCRKSESSDSD